MLERFLNMLFALIRALALLLWGIAATQAQESGLVRLDQILVEAGSVSGFLARTDLQEKYHDALNRYLGPGGITRIDFDKNLADLKKAIQLAPELEERLWDTRNTGEPTRVELALASSGLELKKMEWDWEMGRWKERLTAKGKQFLGVTARPLLEDKMKRLSAELEGFTPQGRNKAEREAFGRDFFKAIRENPDNHALFAALKLIKSEEPGVSEGLRSEDADRVLDSLKVIHDPKTFSKVGEIEVPQSIRTLVAGFEKLKPDQPPLEVEGNRGAESTFFKVRVVRTQNRNSKVDLIPEGSIGKPVLHFEPVPRRFHSIWKGYTVAECVKDSCHRYLTGALKDAEVYFVERGLSESAKAAGAVRSSMGFVQVVPVRDKATGKVYGSVDLMSPVLAKNGVIRHPTTGKLDSIPILESWIKAYKKPLALSKSESMANAGVLPIARRSPGYRFSKPLGSADQFEIVDPGAAELFKKIQPLVSSSFRNNWVLDSTVSDSGDLRRLTQLDRTLLRDPARIGKVIEAVEQMDSAGLKKFLSPVFSTTHPLQLTNIGNAFLKLKPGQRRLLLRALLSQAPWDAETWREVPRFLAEPSWRASISQGLLEQVEWPQDFWLRVPALLDHPVSAPVISRGLIRQPVWPALVWDRVPTLLMDKESGHWMGEAFKKQGRWPEGFWKDVPRLLNQSGTRGIALQGLKNQPEWPGEVWLRVIELGGDPDPATGLMATQLFSGRQLWPDFFWQKVPELLKDPRLGNSIRLGLKNKEAWPDSFWKLLPELLIDPVIDRETLSLIQSRLKVEASRPLALPESFWNRAADLLRDEKKAPITEFLLGREPAWPESFWRIMPMLLSDRELAPVAIRALEGQAAWPESFLKSVPGLISGKKLDSPSRYRLGVQLEKIPELPVSFWGDLPTLLEDPASRTWAKRFLRLRSDWPSSVVERVTEYSESKKDGALSASLLLRDRQKAIASAKAASAGGCAWDVAEKVAKKVAKKLK